MTSHSNRRRIVVNRQYPTESVKDEKRVAMTMATTMSVVALLVAAVRTTSLVGMSKWAY